MSANEERGEISLELEAGVEYVLRPTFTAIQAMETQTGKSLFELAAAADGQALSNKQASIIVLECIKAWAATANGTSPPHQAAASQAKLEKIGKLIYEMRGGLVLCQAVLRTLLIGAGTGNYTSDGLPKQKAAE